MITIPNDALKIQVVGGTVDFYQFNLDGTTYYAFDTSRCGPPEPMINAFAGLKLLDSSDKKLLMINHKTPTPLFEKIGADFSIEFGTRNDGNSEIIFGFKTNINMNQEQYQKTCHD